MIIVTYSESQKDVQTLMQSNQPSFFLLGLMIEGPLRAVLSNVGTRELSQMYPDYSQEIPFHIYLLMFYVGHCQTDKRKEQL